MKKVVNISATGLVTCHVSVQCVCVVGGDGMRNDYNSTIANLIFD